MSVEIRNFAEVSATASANPVGETILLPMADRSDLKRAKEGDKWLLFADLSDADLEGVDLSDARLNEANLSGARLSKANLSHADLYGCDLADAILRNADLRSANLESAWLVGADLRGADLQDSKLVGANFDGADLRDANLRGAVIHITVSNGGGGLGGIDPNPLVDLSRVARYAEPRSWVETADLSEAKLTGATMPDGKLYKSKQSG